MKSKGFKALAFIRGKKANLFLSPPVEIAAAPCSPFSHLLLHVYGTTESPSLVESQPAEDIWIIQNTLDFKGESCIS